MEGENDGDYLEPSLMLCRKECWIMTTHNVCFVGVPSVARWGKVHCQVTPQVQLCTRRGDAIIPQSSSDETGYPPHHITTPHYTTPHHTSPHHHTTLHHTTLHHHTTPHYTTPHLTTPPHHTTPHHTTPPHHTTTLHHTSPPHHTTPLHHTTPYHIAPHSLETLAERSFRAFFKGRVHFLDILQVSSSFLISSGLDRKTEGDKEDSQGDGLTMHNHTYAQDITFAH